MEKPSIRIPHPASFWFVGICLGIGACAFLVLAVVRALCGDILNVFLCLAAAAIFIAGVRFEVRMSGDFFRIDEEAIHIFRDWRETDCLRWDELTSLAIRPGQYRGKPRRFVEAGVQVMKDGACVKDRRVSIPMPYFPAKDASFLLKCMRPMLAKLQFKEESGPRHLER